MKKPNKQKLNEEFKRFMKLSEYAYTPSMIEDAEDDENQQGGAGAPPPPGGNPNGEGMPPAPGGDMGGDPNGGGGAPEMGAGPDQQMGGDQNGGMPPAPGGDMGGDPNGGDMPPAPGMDDGSMPPPPGDDMGSDMMPPEDEGMGDDEEDYDIIDVDQIADAQEKTFKRINKVGRNLGDVDDRISKLMNAIDKMETMINTQNGEIESLKHELIKRNPTQTEKLNLRSLDSYPFNVKPDEFWKNSNSVKDNYVTYSDNSEPTTQEYEITEDDIENYNENDIANSFNDLDDFDMSINRIFGIK